MKMKYKYKISMQHPNGEFWCSESKFCFLTVDSAMKNGIVYANILLSIDRVGTRCMCVEIFNTNREQEARFEFSQI